MTSPDLDPNRSTQDASPAEALAFLWRGRWVIGAITMLAAAGGVVFAEHRGTIWRARSVLYVERESPLMPGNDVSLWLQSRNYANTQAALLRSTPIQQAGIDAVGPSPIFGDSGNHLAWLQRNLRISVGAQDDLITVTLDSRLVEDACNMVNAVVDSYLQFHAESKRETANTVLANLTTELARYEAELQAVQQEQIAFLREHPGVGPAQDAGRLAAERFRELRTALTRADVEVVEAEAAWKAAKSMTASAELFRQLPLVNGSTPAPRPEQAELARLRDQLQRLLSNVTAEHPEVQRLQSMIAATEKTLRDNDAAVAEGYVTLLQLRLEGSRQKAAELRATVEAQEQQIRSVSPAQAEYEAIEARYKRSRSIADDLYNRVRTLDINERLDAARKVELNTLVYEHAAPSSATVASSKRTLVAIATLLGLILGTGLAWLRSLVDQRLRTPEDVAGQVPLLATLPRLGRSSDIRETWRKQPEFAAAMRSLRTVIQFGVRSERNRILQVTSPLERSSNSIITAGLGVAMAQAGDRTLIIDADLDRAQQAGLFHVGGDVGLVQVLSGQSTAAEAVVDTSVPNLRILPVGALSPDMGVLFGDSPLAEVLRQLAADYDRILIDSPPLLVDTDSRIIAAVSDESLLVIRSGRTTRKLVKSALGLIASVAGRIAGAVLEGTSGAAAMGISAEVHPLRSGSGGRRIDRMQRAANPDLDPGRTANAP